LALHSNCQWICQYHIRDYCADCYFGLFRKIIRFYYRKFFGKIFANSSINCSHIYCLWVSYSIFWFYLVKYFIEENF